MSPTVQLPLPLCRNEFRDIGRRDVAVAAGQARGLPGRRVALTSWSWRRPVPGSRRVARSGDVLEAGGRPLQEGRDDLAAGGDRDGGRRRVGPAAAGVVERVTSSTRCCRARSTPTFGSARASAARPVRPSVSRAVLAAQQVRAARTDLVATCRDQTALTPPVASGEPAGHGDRRAAAAAREVMVTDQDPLWACWAEVTGTSRVAWPRPPPSRSAASPQRASRCTSRRAGARTAAGWT